MVQRVKDLASSLQRLRLLLWCGFSPWPRSFLCCLIGQKNKTSVLPVFPSRCFRVSYLTFRFLIHFELIFVYGVREYSNIILLHVAVQFS